MLALFDAIIESSKVGVRKPDPRFYEMACERSASSRTRRCSSTTSASTSSPPRAMGMTTIKVTDPEPPSPSSRRSSASRCAGEAVTLTDLGEWVPLDPVEVRRVFAAYDRPWWIAGGWAIDMSLGRKTREHGDVDVELLRSDWAAVQHHLRGWELYLAHGVLDPWLPGEPPPPDVNDVWCRPVGGTSWAFQLMFNPGTDDAWASKRNTTITRPMAQAVRRTGDGIPYLAPELQLLMKAKGRRPKDDADFANVVGTLDDEARAWLRSALGRVHPDHDWLTELG